MRLIQLCMHMHHTCECQSIAESKSDSTETEPSSTQQTQPPDDSDETDGMAFAEAQQCLQGVEQLIAHVRLSCPHCAREQRLSPPSPSYFSARRVLLRWVLFVRAALQLLYRCRPVLSSRPLGSRPSSVTGLKWTQVLEHTSALRLPLPLPVSLPSPTTYTLYNSGASNEVDTAFGLYMNKASGWLEGVLRCDAWEQCVLVGGWHYPAERPASLISLPEAYTKLHGQLCAQCDYEYPALCLMCGAVLDAGGKGQCTAHVRACGADSGVMFLLQVRFVP
jgi:hypothetical protein